MTLAHKDLDRLLARWENCEKLTTGEVRSLVHYVNLIDHALNRAAHEFILPDNRPNYNQARQALCRRDRYTQGLELHKRTPETE